MASRMNDVITLSDSEDDEAVTTNNFERLLFEVDCVHGTLLKMEPVIKVSKDDIFAILEKQVNNKNRILTVLEHFRRQGSVMPVNTNNELTTNNSDVLPNLQDKLPNTENGVDANPQTKDDEQEVHLAALHKAISYLNSAVLPINGNHVAPPPEMPSTSTYNADHGVNGNITDINPADNQTLDLSLHNVASTAPEFDASYERLLKDAESVMMVLPQCDFNDVCVRLKAQSFHPDRVNSVIDILISLENVLEQNVPVMENVASAKRDLEIPHIDSSLKKPKVALEPNVNDVPRIGAYKVVNDGEVAGPSSALVNTGVPDSISHSDQIIKKEADEIVPTVNGAEDVDGNEEGRENFQIMLQNLKETFPNADPDFLMEIVLKFGNQEDDFQAKVLEMLENADYPKLKDRQEREKMEVMKKTYMTRVYTPEDVLQWVENPIEFFNDISRPISAAYRHHAIIQAYNDFPKLTATSINGLLHRSKFHYLPVYHLMKRLEELEKPTPRYKKRKVRPRTELPAVPDELFYKELAFTRIEAEFKEYIATKAKIRKQKIDSAKLNGTFLTCQCCFDEEILMDDAVDCGNGHVFCQECVCRGAEVTAGQGQCHLNCMAGDCDSKFPLQALRIVLKPNVFSNWLIRLQAEELSQANIPDLVHCPHCNFAAIMPNPEDKVFHCLNPECLKETCRLCKEPNHIPLRCDEIEKGSEVKMRTYIEDKMTEALIRVCPKCHRRFMKEIGCNMMKCICGQNMCYVCRQPIKDYSHFGKDGCPQDINTDELHRREVADGGVRAKQAFVEQHPELSGVQLKHDPTANISASGSNDVQLIPNNELEEDVVDDDSDSTDYQEMDNLSITSDDLVFSSLEEDSEPSAELDLESNEDSISESDSEFVNEDGEFVDEDGEFVDEDGEFVDEDGEFVDEDDLPSSIPYDDLHSSSSDDAVAVDGTLDSSHNSDAEVNIDTNDEVDSSEERTDSSTREEFSSSQESPDLTNVTLISDEERTSDSLQHDDEPRSSEDTIYSSANDEYSTPESTSDVNDAQVQDDSESSDEHSDDYDEEEDQYDSSYEIDDDDDQ